MMKQHITTKQLNEVDKKKVFNILCKNGRSYADDCFKEFSDDELLLTIGEMIEFLGEGWHHHLFYERGGKKGNWTNVCDALWSACVEVLESK